MTLRKQLIITLAASLLVMSFMTLRLSWMQWQVLRASWSTQVNVAHALQLTKLVHYLQVERGQSAGYISSGGVNFSQDLPISRRNSDQAISELSDVSSELSQRLAQLSSMRNSVTDTELSVGEMARFYTGTIRVALKTVGEDLSNLSKPSATKIGSGLIALAEAKEAAGLQRAAGATGLGMGAFSIDVYRWFAERGAAETATLLLAQNKLRELEENLRFEENMAHSGISEARQLILSTPIGSNVPNLSAPEWFAISTDWIERLRASEATVSEVLTGQAKAQARVALLGVLLTLALAFASLCGTFIIGMAFLNRFSSGVRLILSAMQNLSRKNYDIPVPTDDNQTEVGQICVAIDHTRNELRAADEKEHAENASGRNQVIAELGEALCKLADQNLQHRILEEFPEGYDDLRVSYNSAVENLCASLGAVSSSVENMRHSSQEVAKSAQDLSKRSGLQAASLEETTATLSLLSDTIQKSSKSALETNKAMNTLKGEATSGLSEINDTVAAITRVSESASETSKMVGMIEEISFQTNLLALNAGIEAARAGDAGKGFSVVASEVRALAVRATEVTEQIKSVMDHSMKTVEEGVSLARRAGESFASISSGVQKTGSFVAKIAEDIQGQASGIDDIKGSMLELDQVTQKNAAMADSAAELGKKLLDGSQDVSEQLSDFYFIRTEQKANQYEGASHTLNQFVA